MGLFDRLFKKDPEKELQKAEALLGRGEDLEKALKSVQRLADSGPDPFRERARELTQRLHTAIVAQLLENARRSEAAGYRDDAADWIESALAHVSDAGKRAELEAKIKTFRADTGTTAAPLITAAAQKTSSPDAEEEQDVDFEFHFDALIGMLRPEIAESYKQKPASFHKAFVALNNDDLDTASECLEALLSQAPADPIYLFEQARLFLVKGDVASARTHLERAWSHFGDDCLDEAGHISVPGLWADAMLQLGQPDAVADKLEHLADPKLGRPLISQSYALALEAAGHLADAREFLIVAGTRFENQPNFRYILARILLAEEKWEDAVHVLETVVDPSCSSGQCSMPKHPASMRMLIGLYLAHDIKLRRAGELLMHLERTLHGNLSRGDLLMAAMFHRKSGDTKAAEAAEEEASRLTEDEGNALDAGVDTSMAGASQAVL